MLVGLQYLICGYKSLFACTTAFSTAFIMAGIWTWKDMSSGLFHTVGYINKQVCNWPNPKQRATRETQKITAHFIQRCDLSFSGTLKHFFAEGENLFFCVLIVPDNFSQKCYMLQLLCNYQISPYRWSTLDPRGRRLPSHARRLHRSQGPLSDPIPALILMLLAGEQSHWACITCDSPCAVMDTAVVKKHINTAETGGR